MSEYQTGSVFGPMGTVRFMARSDFRQCPKFKRPDCLNTELKNNSHIIFTSVDGFIYKLFSLYCKRSRLVWFKIVFGSNAECLNT